MSTTETQSTSLKRAADSTSSINPRDFKVAKIINSTNQSVIVRTCDPPENKEGILVAEPVLITSWREHEIVNNWCKKLLPPLTPASQVMCDLHIKLARPGQRLGLSLGERAGVVVVTAAEKGEPGSVAGALAGDVLTTVGDEGGPRIPVHTVQEMVQALHARSEKTSLTIQVRRDVWEPHQTTKRATIGGGAPVSICGLSCQMCPSWWQKEGKGGDVVQIIELYSPVLGSLVYSTGGGAVSERRALPSGLQKVLGHSRLIKVGVQAHQNAIRIANNFAVVVTGVHNLTGGTLSLLSKRHCPPDLHLSKISPEQEIRSQGDWNAWPLSGEQCKFAALSVVVAYWVCAGKRGGVWPTKSIEGTVNDLLLSPAVVPTVSPQLQQQIRAKKLPNRLVVKEIMPYKTKPSESLKGHNMMVSGVLTTVSLDVFQTYVANHGGSICTTIMENVTTLIVSEKGTESISQSDQDKAAALGKKIPIVDVTHVFDLVRTKIEAKVREAEIANGAPDLPQVEEVPDLKK